MINDYTWCCSFNLVKKIKKKKWSYTHQTWYIHVTAVKYSDFNRRILDDYFRKAIQRVLFFLAENRIIERSAANNRTVCFMPWLRILPDMETLTHEILLMTILVSCLMEPCEMCYVHGILWTLPRFLKLLFVVQELEYRGNTPHALVCWK